MLVKQMRSGLFSKAMSFTGAGCLLAGLAVTGLTLGGCQSSGSWASAASAGKDTVWVVSATEQGKYRHPQLPKPIASFGAVANDGYIYIYGGHQVPAHNYYVEAVSKDFYRLKLNGGARWEELPSGPRIQGMNLATWNNRIYRLGGMQPRNEKGQREANYSIVDAAYYDIAKGKWVALPDLPEPRSSHDQVVIDDKMYVFAGWNMNPQEGDEWYTTGLVLDLKDPKAQWKVIDQPFVRRALIMAAYEGKAWVIGGLDDGNEISRDVDIYDPATGKWSKGPSLPGSQMNGFSPAAVVADGTLYVSTFDGALHRLNKQTNAWEKVIQATPRIVHRMVSNGNDLVLVGGAAGRGRMLDLVETVTLSAHGATLDVLPDSGAKVFDESQGRRDGARTGTNGPRGGNPHAGQGDSNPHAGNPHGSNPHTGNPHAQPKPAPAPVPAPAPEAPKGDSAQPQPAADAQSAATGQKVCPVMTGAEIGSKDDIVVSYQGKEVRLCCDACLSKWNRDTAAYLLPEFLPQLAGLQLPGRGIAQVFCPVYKDRVVSAKDPSVQYEGKTVYLYSHAAVRRWNADPAKYADPKLLPQLAQQ